MPRSVEDLLALRNGVTEGPWSRGRMGRVYAPDGRSRVEVAVIGNYFDAEITPFNRDRWDADARAIAAVPELFTRLDEQRAEIERLRSLLTKALPYTEGYCDGPVRNDGLVLAGNIRDAMNGDPS